MENDKGVGASTGNDNDNISLINKLKKGALDAATTIRLIAQYTTIFITSQVKKLGAKDEKEMMEADLQEERMQVDATDAAEAERKKHEQEALGFRNS